MANENISESYAKLGENQFKLALFGAYENIVRMEKMGTLDKKDKEHLLSDVKGVLEEAKLRYPDAGPALPEGSFFKDKDYAAVEAQLMPFLREAAKSNRAVLGEDVNRYESWRNNEPYVLKGPMFTLKEHPFNNTNIYGSDDRGTDLYGRFGYEHCCRTPLERANEVPSDGKARAQGNEPPAKQPQKTENTASKTVNGFENSAEYQMAKASYEARRKNIERAQKFMNGAKSLGNRVKGAVKKAKESLKKFGHGLAEGIKNDAGKISDSFLEFCSDIRDMGGTMKESAQEGIGKALKPVKFVGKAALNTFMAGAGYLAGKGTKLAHKMKVKTKGFVLRRIVDAKNFLKNAVNVYTANAIENKKKLRSVRRSIKEGLKNFGYGIKNKFEDLSYTAGEKAGKAKESAKGFFNRISKSVQGKMDTAHYGLLVAKDAAGKFMTDKIDTVHYGLLVAKDGINKVLQPAKIVSKAALHTFAAGAGYIGEEAKHAKFKGLRRYAESKDFIQTKADEFKKSAKNVYTANAIEATKAVRSARRAVKDGLTNFGYGIKNKFEDLSYTAGEKAGKAKESAKGFFNRISGSISKGKDALKSGFEQYVGKPVRNQTAAAVLAMTVNANVLKADISGRVSSARAVISGKLGTVKDAFSEKAGTVRDTVDSVQKIGKETAKSWLGNVSKTFVGGKKLAENIVSRIQSGSEKALGAVGNTLSGATQSITKGMETARVSVQNRARGDMGAWLRAGKMASYSK